MNIFFVPFVIFCKIRFSHRRQGTTCGQGKACCRTSKGSQLARIRLRIRSPRENG